MASARYWRLVGFDSTGDVELAGVQLYAGGARVDASATLTSTIAPVSGTIANLQDTDTATTCKFAGSSVRSAGFALNWDFGSVTVVDAVRLAASTAALWPFALDLECLDGAQWKHLATLGKIIYPGSTQWTPPLQFEQSSLAALFHFNGASGSTVFTDDSPSPATQSGSGVTISAAQSKFGGTSAYFNGSGVLKLGNAADPRFKIGTKDFAFEAWVYDTGSGNRRTLAGNAASNGGDLSLSFLFLNQTYPYSEVRVGGTAYSITSSVAGPTNEWYLFGMFRNGTTLTMRINGVSVGSATLPAGLDIPAGVGHFAIGSGGDYFNAGGPYGTNWIGYVDDWRFVIGHPVQTADFTPYSTPFDNAEFSGVAAGLESMPVVTVIGRSQTAFSSAVPTACTRAQRASLLARDMEFGGRARITGDVGIKGASGAPDSMTKSRVRLLRARDGLLARETWSDAATGAFVFDGLDEATEFIALAQDSSGSFRPVAADRVVPEVPA